MLQAEDILSLSHKVGQSGHWFLRLSDNTFFFSEEVFRLHGLSPDAAQPTLGDALEFYHPHDRDRVESLLNKTLETGTPLHFEARIVRADGEILWIEILGEIKHSPNSNTRYLFGILRDITENQQQRLHNQRLAWVLENTEEVILMTDTAGCITWANGAFETITGYSLDEALGQKPGHLLQGPDTDADTIAYMHDRLIQEKDFTCEVLNYTKRGDPYWLRISCQPEIDAEGRLRGFTSIQTDVTEEKRIRLDLEAEIKKRSRLEEQLRYMATHDELSALPNRRYFMQQASDELVRARRHERDLSLLIIDLDLFKLVNDQYGHSAGDEVIQGFAERCMKMLRETDTPARIGGEEFAVLLPETEREAAIQTAERLRRLIEETPVDTQAGPIPLTLSIGVASYCDECRSIETLIQTADSRLYEAKRNGRNQVV